MASDEQLLEEFLFFDDSAAAAVSEIVSQAPSKAKWADSDDENVQVDISAVSRMRKLRKTRAEQTVSGADYESRLRAQFEAIHGKQAWAAEKSKDAISTASDDSEVEDLVASTKSRLKAATGEEAALSFSKCSDINYSAGKRAGSVSCMSWAQSTHVGSTPIIATMSSKDKNLVRVWSVAGTKDHELIATLQPPKRFRTSHAAFISESLLVVIGPQRGVVVFDVHAQKEHTFLHTIGGRFDRKFLRLIAGDCSRFAVEADNGDVLLINSKTFSLVSAIKLNTGLAGWAFYGNSFYCLDKRCGIYRFDADSGKCLQKLIDDQTVAPVSLDVSNSHILVGSAAGTVDMIKLGDDGILPEVVNTSNTKTFDRLTTKIDSLVMLPQGDAFIAASSEKPNALRACFLSSGHTLPGWPTLGDKFGQISSIACAGDLMALGSTSGRVMLLSVKRPYQL